MCGIIAITGNNTEKTNDTLVSGMLSCLSRRGPDDKGFLRIGESVRQTLLGQTRLSIIDITGGHQPMRDNSRPFTIVFNGEIYNYKKLRLELEKKGHNFSTDSDTEVILKTYIEYGNECPKYLDGMFAFALWNEETNELFIARDRFGKKPFYYTWIDDTFWGASEIKALFASGQIKGRVDLESLDDYLRLMYIPPWKTIYSNIHTLPPAHAGIVKNGKLHTWKYWQLENSRKDKPLDISYEDAKKEVKRLFNDAVQKRMLADVEIGSLLSGGIDSTMVTAYAQKYVPHPIKTFSIGYEGYINELPFAKQASEKIGTEHYALQATSELITQGLRDIIAYMDEPHADSSDFPQHLISQLASSKVKVALSGDGADELFMGYGWYWKYWNTRKIVRLKNMIFSGQFKEHLKNVEVFSKTDRLGLWKNPSVVEDRIEKECTNILESRGTKKINLFDLTVYLPGQLLTKVDRTSMMHSLEVRSPFLDYKLAEFVYNLPEKYKMNKKSGKIILKDILTEIMPREFIYRRKQGFGAPIKEWLRTEDVKKFVEKTLGKTSEGDENAMYNLFKREKIFAILSDFYDKQDDSMQYKIWSLLCLALWFNSHQKYHE